MGLSKSFSLKVKNLENVPAIIYVDNGEIKESDVLDGVNGTMLKVGDLEKLLDIYEDFVFKVDVTNKNQVVKLEQLDLILGKYIDDYFFRKELRTEMQKIRVRKDEDILTAIVDWIIKVFDNYEVGYTRNIYFSRWI